MVLRKNPEAPKNRPLNDEGSYSARQSRILIVSLTLASAALVAVVWWYYTRQRDAAETAAENELTAIADAKTKQIANWRHERLGDGLVVASSPVMRIAARVLSGRTATESDRTDILRNLNGLAQAFSYSSATLVDFDGNVRIQLNPDHADSAHLREFARAAAQSGKVDLSDLYREPQSGRMLMAVTIPVAGAGAFVLDIDAARFLYPYLEFWPTVSRTAETDMVRREGDEILYLNELRHKHGTALVFRRSIAGTYVPDEKVFMRGWLRKAKDYRGVPALIMVRRIPNSPWYLSAKIDVSEVEAPLRRLWWEIASIIVLIGLANAAGVGLIRRSRQLDIHREREKWFRTVANDTPAYLWLSSATDDNVFLNKPLADFLGMDPGYIQWNRTNYVHPEDEEWSRARIRECQARRCEYSAEYRIRRFDGEYRWAVSHGLPRFSSKGEFIGHAGSLLDVTERKQAEAQLRTTNAALAEELEERTRAEKEIQALSARLINAQEEERMRLARELHDDLSQQVAALSIATSNLKADIPEEQAGARAQSDRLQQKLADLAEGIRRLSHDLHPAVLEHAGLAAALRAYCSEFSKLTGVRVALEAEGPFDGLPSTTSLCIYRIVQEGLQNVVKHARVIEASVQLRRSLGVVNLTIADRGAGMAPERTGAAVGLGLVSIKERTRLVNGTVSIQSTPNRGTTITVSIPADNSTAAGA
jgi:two-component system sensor histidine kinase UhpB